MECVQGLSSAAGPVQAEANPAAFPSASGVPGVKPESWPRRRSNHGSVNYRLGLWERDEERVRKLCESSLESLNVKLRVKS